MTLPRVTGGISFVIVRSVSTTHRGHGRVVAVGDLGRDRTVRPRRGGLRRSLGRGSATAGTTGSGDGQPAPTATSVTAGAATMHSFGYSTECERRAQSSAGGTSLRRRSTRVAARSGDLGTGSRPARFLLVDAPSEQPLEPDLLARLERRAATAGRWTAGRRRPVAFTTVTSRTPMRCALGPQPGDRRAAPRPAAAAGRSGRPTRRGCRRPRPGSVTAASRR